MPPALRQAQKFKTSAHAAVGSQLFPHKAHTLLFRRKIIDE